MQMAVGVVLLALLLNYVAAPPDAMQSGAGGMAKNSARDLQSPLVAATRAAFTKNQQRNRRKPANEVRLKRSGLCWPEPISTPLPDLWGNYPGEVRIEMIISVDGIPRTATLLSSTYDRKTSNGALRTIKKWQFKPALKDSRPAVLKLETVIQFQKDSATIRFPMLAKHRGCSSLGSY